MPDLIDPHINTNAKYFFKNPSERKSNNLLYYGIELEVDRDEIIESNLEEKLVKKIKKINSNLHIKRDSSLSYGFEIVDQPCTLQYIYDNFNNWDQIFELLLEYQYTNDNAAGFHIHFNSCYLNEENKKKLRYFVNSQRVLFQKIGRRKTGFHYEYVKVNKKIYEDEFLANHNCQRNECINFANMDNDERPTIEFRLFRSTIDKQIFLATIEFIDLVIKFVNFIDKEVILSKDGAKLAFIGFCIKHIEDYKQLEIFKKIILTA
jgi:hypothetical protein